MRGSFSGTALRGAAILCAVALLAPVSAVAEEGGVEPLPALSQAAEQGSATAQYELGVAYANGDGVAADYGQAAHWFAEAAHNGNADARRQLAFMTQIGLADAAGAAAGGDATFRVQVASVASEADGAREWRRLQRLHPEVLGNLTMAVEGFSTAGGDQLFQVEGGPLDADGARAICGKLRAEGAGCRVVHPAP